ncbi:hypothetical protein IJI18_03335 [Candidatus Saccharibacteria bacterium]|nr:hypothetical protein [Candidatus Saccharibacteria bacterium]
MASGPSRKRQNGAALRQKMRCSLTVPKSTARSAAPSSSRSIHSSASFKIYQRKEFVRDLEMPGMGYHVFYTSKLIFENYRIFLPLLFVMTVVMLCLTGLATEFLNGQTVIFGSLVFLIIWLTSIFIIRHKMAGNKIGVRDALYNALTPLLSSLVVLAVVAVQCIPIMILVVAYSSAIETHFLDMPFYAFLFFTFGALMILLSAYFLSGSLMALVAVSAPGLYPLEALKTTNELMRGRRIKFILRIILVLFLVTALWVVIMFPVAALGSDFSSFIKVCGVTLACFLAIYVSVYFYVYYRWLLDFSFEKEKQK